MDMHEEQNSQDMNQSFDKNNEITLEKKIGQKKPKRRKITSKICKKSGPPKAPNLVRPKTTPLKSIRKKEKASSKRQNGRKRKYANIFANETIYPNESMAFECVDAHNIDRRIDSTPTYEKFEEEHALLTPLSRRQMLKKQLEFYRRRKSGAMSGIQNETFMSMSTQHISPNQIDSNVTLSGNSFFDSNINFSSFPKFHKRRRMEKEASSPTIFLRHKIFTFAIAHRLITPTIIEMLRNMLETRRVEVKNKRFDLSIQTFNLNRIASNVVRMQSTTTTTTISTLVKVREIQEKQPPTEEHQQLALIPYVYPLNSSEQNQNHDVNKNGWQKNICNHQSALVPYQGAGVVVPYKRQPNRYRLSVAWDTRNTWLWNCFASNEQLPKDGTFDYETKIWWENERRIFKEHAEAFLAKIRLIQGNRRFSKWKGSIVDSVVGVFLTQNVSDLLSSSSFINLIARFPIKSKENANEVHSVETLPIEISISTLEEKDKCVEVTDDSKEYASCSQSSIDTTFSLTNDLIQIPIEVEDNAKFLSKCDTIASCKTCMQSSICSDVEDLLGNYSCHQFPSKGPIVSSSKSTTFTHFESKSEHLQEETRPNKILSANLEALKVPNFHLKEVRKMSTKNSTPKAKMSKVDNKSSNNIDWEMLRKETCHNFPTKERSNDYMDSANWEATSQADIGAIADAIRLRGQHNILATRIKNFLNRVAKDHGSIDLEWLRNVSPNKAKEYLRSIDGLGLKSVDCVRLLALHFKAFPVDTNIARILVRLGWIPLQPLPESAQLHAIDQYPIMGTIQEYLWPRLWTFDQPTLYELHYQLITFGKVFCTKKNPNCNACPLRDECKHFASAYANAKKLITGPKEKTVVNSVYSSISSIDSFTSSSLLPIAQVEEGQLSQNLNSISCEPIIEEPSSPKPEHLEWNHINYSEDYLYNSDEDIIVELNLTGISQNFEQINEAKNTKSHEDENSNLALIATPFVSCLMPTLKSVNKFRTKHYVYELPSNHPLLEGMDELEENDEYRYLFAIWKPGENAESTEPPINYCNFQSSDELCDNNACFRCNGIREAKSETVRGTLLIPCRTAMRGRFPLNGTYFQVNEVFADNKSSKNPLVVPRSWLWNLRRKICYFGTGISTIFRGLTTAEIRFCMSQGTVCVRGFDRETRRVELLYKRLHVPASQATKKKSKPENKD